MDSVFLFFFYLCSPTSVGMVLGPAVSMAYMDTTPVAAHALSAEMVEGKTQ